jgi:hypothetical protein
MLLIMRFFRKKTSGLTAGCGDFWVGFQIKISGSVIVVLKRISRGAGRGFLLRPG